MNIEIEKKYKIQDCVVAKQEITALGAQFKSESRDSDVYYVVPQEKPNTRYLRIRTKQGKSTLAFHEVIDNLQTKEWETDVASGEVAKGILHKLGFSVDVTVNKTRQRYKFGASEILIDHIEDLGYFIEIESPTEQELDGIATRITLGEQIVGKGYPDLLKEKNK